MADLKKLMAETKKEAPPPQPAIEYRPTYKDPPVNPVSPGNGELLTAVFVCALGSSFVIHMSNVWIYVIVTMDLS